MASRQPQSALRHPVPAAGSRLRVFITVCGAAAIVVAALAQLVVPARGSPVVAWLGTVVLPGFIVGLVLANRRDRLGVLALICVLIYAEAVLLASLYTVGIAFAILLPMIGIGLIQAHVRGWPRMIAYVGAVVVATVAVGIAEAGIPENPLGADDPILAVTAFGLVAAFALGLTWYAGERLGLALDAAEREIEARAEAERQLGRTADTLERLIDSSPVATLALDAAGRIDVWNPAAERLFGWSAAEARGAELPFPADEGAGAASLRERILRALAGEAIVGEEVRGHTRDGRRFLVVVHSAERRDAFGRPDGIIVQAVDVTERSALEARLRQAEKMEAVGHLAGGIAHDINNTLTAVGGFAEIIEAEATTEEIRADAATITRSVERATELTSRLLAFARRSVLQPQTLEVAGLVASIEPMLRGLLGADVEVVVHDEAPGAAISVDPAQFEQAILNLAVNARDAMPGGGTLTIATRRIEQEERGLSGPGVSAPGPGAGAPVVASRPGGAGAAPGGAGERTAGGSAPEPSARQIAISVSDTGTGIPSELQAQVFEPFFTTKARGRGTGLGLPMVYGFVKQSGGEVALRSTPGLGTTVEIRLPEVAASPVPAPFAVSAAPAAGGTETILLVEDEPTVAQIGHRILAGLGYDVIEARNGGQAIELAGAHDGPIGLILSDVIMPGMTGPEVVRAVLTRHPEAAVLYVSGYTADVIADRGVLPPGVELVPKPFTAAELAARVRSVLDAHAGERVAGADGADDPGGAAGGSRAPGDLPAGSPTVGRPARIVSQPSRDD